MRQGQKVDFGVFIGQASFREPKELNPGDRFIQLDKHYDGPVALPPASGLSLPGLPIRSATKRACHAVDGRERSRGKLVQSQGLSPRSSAGLLFGLLARTCDRHRHRRRAAFFFGRDAVSGQVASSIKDTLGDTGAQAVQAMLADAGRPRQGLIATLLGLTGSADLCSDPGRGSAQGRAQYCLGSRGYAGPWRMAYATTLFLLPPSWRWASF